MPSTVRIARAPTDLKPNLIRVKKRDDERARIGRWRLTALSQKERGRLQCGVCPEKRMAKQERQWTRKVSASLMAIASHLPKGWVSERYSCSDSSACLRLRMRCATPMHSTAPPAIQVKVTPLRPVSGRPTDLVLPTLMVISPWRRWCRRLPCRSVCCHRQCRQAYRRRCRCGPCRTRKPPP